MKEICRYLQKQEVIGMKTRIRNVITFILVITIICSTLLIANASAVPFANKSVSGSYKYLASNIKSVATNAAVEKITYLVGGNLVNIRAGTTSTSVYTYSTRAGTTVNITLQSPYNTVGDNISLYGYGLSGTTTASGNWDPN